MTEIKVHLSEGNKVQPDGALYGKRLKKLNKQVKKKRRKKFTPFGCTECGFASFSQKGFINHVRLTHMDMLKVPSIVEKIKQSLSWGELNEEIVKSVPSNRDSTPRETDPTINRKIGSSDDTDAELSSGT